MELIYFNLFFSKKIPKPKINSKGGNMQKTENKSVQNWLPFESILENGTIKINNNEYIKILKINPINFNLKSELEKESILNSYKIFLKTCNFNFQILIQRNKEDLSKHISVIQNQLISEKNNIPAISKKYIEYIKKLNYSKKSSSKNFYIIIKYINQNNQIENIESYAIQELNDKYFKIKDCLSRCGNIVEDISEKEKIKNILFSFFNKRIYLKNNE